MTKLRRFYWKHIRRYDAEICQDCGRAVAARHLGPYTWWSAPDWLWLRVMVSEWGVLCPPCFTKRCWKLKISISWKPNVERIF